MRTAALISTALVAVLGFAGHAIAERPLVRLGEALFEDVNLSRNANQACETCHHPLAGFADTSNHADPVGSPVSDGSVDPHFGGRNAPSAAYAGYSPPLSCTGPDGDLFCTGGVFWDGRATGLESSDTAGISIDGAMTGPTFDPLADQAKGPFQNPVEMGLMPDEVIDIVTQADYAKLFRQAFGYDVRWQARNHAERVYNDIAIAIAAYERSDALNKFSSKFDRFVDEQSAKQIDVSTIVLADEVAVDAFGEVITSNVFLPEELEGLALFNMPNDNNGTLEAGEGANCAACHPSGPITDPTDSQGEILFTDFSYDNLGIPENEAIAELAGQQAPDVGLYATLTNLLGYSPEAAAGTEGLFKVPTLRNVGVSAPYGHNGYFPTLYSIVHFYNTRISEPHEGPEAGEPNEVELGNLGLSKDQEEKLVLFMETLTDQDQKYERKHKPWKWFFRPLSRFRNGFRGHRG